MKRKWKNRMKKMKKKKKSSLKYLISMQTISFCQNKNKRKKKLIKKKIKDMAINNKRTIL